MFLLHEETTLPKAKHWKGLKMSNLRFTPWEFRRIYSSERFRPLWNYENRVVLVEKDSSKCHFFCKNASHIDFILATSDFEFGRSIAEDVWSPKAKPTEFSTKNFLLNHIEGMVSSMVKKGQTDKLTKFDFSAVYYARDGMHAYYPPVEELIAFHEAKPEQNEAYLEFLRSAELKERIADWNKEEGITIPTPPSEKKTKQ